MKKVFMTLAIAGMLLGAVSCGNNKKAAEGEEAQKECACEGKCENCEGNCENCEGNCEKKTIEGAVEQAANEVKDAAQNAVINAVENAAAAAVEGISK